MFCVVFLGLGERVVVVVELGSGGRLRLRVGRVKGGFEGVVWGWLVGW